jgi:hypothetical protein
MGQSKTRNALRILIGSLLLDIHFEDQDVKTILKHILQWQVTGMMDEAGLGLWPKAS